VREERKAKEEEEKRRKEEEDERLMLELKELEQFDGPSFLRQETPMFPKQKAEELNQEQQQEEEEGSPKMNFQGSPDSDEKFLAQITLPLTIKNSASYFEPESYDQFILKKQSHSFVEARTTAAHDSASASIRESRRISTSGENSGKSSAVNSITKTDVQYAAKPPLAQRENPSSSTVND